MAIQWFPGHMHKAGLEIKKKLPEIDLVIEVLDARIPFSSANPMLSKLRGDKPCIKLLNKTDLADPEMTATWQQYLEQEQGVKTLAISAQQHDCRQVILQLVTEMLPDVTSSVRKIQAMIMGIPNVGKSTLINTLAERQIAKTGNEPAITKMQQRIKIDNVMVLHDTPGVLWGNLENPGTGYRLAVSGAIKETAFENEDIALYAAAYLLKQYPEALQQRFNLDTLPENETALLETLAVKRGCLRAGGMPDLERISKILLTELRAGKLAPITLETPQMMETELVELEQIRAEKAEKKALRKQKKNR
ncbi:ribosome biogenesis GTPase YlqF [Methylophaga sp. OBS3]|uniref:ribosome biogenesis GTPase YlqF n=1 Tax=Methylophaga sp. OBS3 TaxID=2991934 RepID=UPI00225BB79C|nr:ribosome biogenesis GTPase YlqF [Methylophaga sp. OBS3]MCX4190541.1 ribosome biogenesis GTPase YlqF [Methylophaga sp. OBS3]